MLPKKIILALLLNLLLLSQALAIESNEEFFSHWLKQKSQLEDLTPNTFLRWSYQHIFKDRRYQLSALGEGKSSHFATEPELRHDAYDCMTFAVTLLAVYHAHNYVDMRQLLQKLNYQTTTHFLTRRHFPSTDWNPMLSQLSFAKDITQDLGLPTIPARVTIDKISWYKKSILPKFEAKKSAMSMEQRQEWQQFASQLQARSATLSIIPVSVFFRGNKLNSKRFKQIPGGTLVEFVNPHWPKLKQQIGTRILVSHMGFIVDLGTKKMLLHASSITGKIILQDFGSYLKFLHTKATDKGIHLLKILPLHT